MRTDKYKRALSHYNGFKGERTIEHVMSTIPAGLCNRLTGRDVGIVMSIRNAAYYEGRASLGGIDVCDDCVWLPWGSADGINDGMLVPISILRQIKQTPDGTWMLAAKEV